MSTQQILQFVDPYRLARNCEQIQGVIPMVHLSRLTEAVGAQQGDCQVELTFARDLQRQVYIQGHLQAMVSIVCQRCLKPLQIKLDNNFLLAVVGSDAQAAQLPAIYEPLIMEHESLALWPVLEDELLLSLPIVSYHINPSCEILVEKTDSNEISINDDKKTHPFDVLKDLSKRY